MSSIAITLDDELVERAHNAFWNGSGNALEDMYAAITAYLQGADEKGFTLIKRPTTLAELREAYGAAQARFAQAVLGDQSKGVGLSAADSKLLYDNIDKLYL
jgi:hypothetical protein